MGVYDALKKAKYEHLGMKTVRTRKIADNSFMYDLVWEPEESAGTAEGGVGMYETYE